jgi:hypothetical protein
MYAITLLPVSRTSSLLACVGLSYEETLSFHKLTGASLCRTLTCTTPSCAKRVISC